MMPDRASLYRDFLMTDVAAPVVSVTREEVPVCEPVDAVIAIGAFDGFHIGHRALISQTVEDARARGLRAVAVTFDPDPDRVVGPGPAPKLMAVEDRLRVLAGSGVDEVLVVTFDRELAAYDHAAFFERVLAPRLSVHAVHVGLDFRLGRGGASSVEVIRAWGAPRGMDVVGHDLVSLEGEAVCSTRIRTMLQAGDVEDACRALGRHYAVRGTIASGRGQGTQMGFPTANIESPEQILMPADGVYAGLALVGDTVWPAAINVGLPPTFADAAGSAHLEANLIGFSGDIRGSDTVLAFCRYLRPSRVFANTEELIATVLGNIESIREEFGESGVRLHDLG